MYLQRRRRKWFAFHDLPADAQEKLGKRRFTQRLDTEDHDVAKRRAALLEARWRGEIERVRRFSPDAVEREAEFWNRLLREAPDDNERDLIKDAIADAARERVEKAAVKAGIIDDRHEDFHALPEVADASKFVRAATGQLIRTGTHVEEYLATLKNEAKTIDMKRSTLGRLGEQFPYLEDITRKSAQQWINTLSRDEGKSAKTILRILSEVRGYWSYLVSLEAVPEDSLPFHKLTIPKAPKKDGKKNGSGANGWKPFEPKDAVRLLRAAKKKDDDKLVDLIRLGMWTGARIEELCALRTAKVHRDYFEVEDAKTEAGWRQVPLHSKLKPVIARLVKDSSDGYVLSGLSFNKFGDRSNAIGKRFGRLKAELGFDDRFVFHSIRKTVATLFENAKVPEGIAADIMGHDKPTMTYGLYSGGASLKVKKEAIEKLSYPGAD